MEILEVHSDRQCEQWIRVKSMGNNVRKVNLNINSQICLIVRDWVFLNLKTNSSIIFLQYCDTISIIINSTRVSESQINLRTNCIVA